jgi:gliding motility-associated-like protein
MYGTNICGINGDSTRKIGTIPDKDSIPSRVDIVTATVENNKNVRVLWKHYPKKDFYYYMLYRQEAGTGEFLMYNVSRNINDTSFLDTSVDVQSKSYCYLILVQNQCGLSSPNGNTGCTILLKGQSIPFEHHLNWNAYKVWTNGVDNYQIIRHDPATPDAVIGINPGSSLNYVDSKLNYDQGIYWYHVVATEAPGGNGAKSVSNEIRLVQSPLLHVPNAFTPNNDSINDIWATVPVFVKDYHLKIYNRWGQFIWETSNKHENWKGIYHSDSPFNNVYIWQVEYTGWDNSTFYRTGYLTVLP